MPDPRFPDPKTDPSFILRRSAALQGPVFEPNFDYFSNGRGGATLE